MGLTAIFYFGFYKSGERIIHGLEAEDVESIDVYAYTGGAPSNDSWEVTLSEEEVGLLMDLFRRTKLSYKVHEGESDGAFMVYYISLKNEKQIEIYPGNVFAIDGRKYRLVNKKIWKEYLDFNGKLR